MMLLNSDRGERVSLDLSQSSSQESKKDEKIRKLKTLVKDLKQENRKLKASSVFEENKMLPDQLEKAYTIEDDTERLPTLMWL